MSIHELFERHYADQNDSSEEEVRACRQVDGSYMLPSISRAFRYFKAGFEANQGEKMQVLGYLTPKEIHLALTRHPVELAPYPLDGCTIGCYAKESDALNKGGE